MAELFTNGELASYLQVPEVDNATADLLRGLVTTEIRQYAGTAVWDALADADKQAFKGLALEAVKRSFLNPSGLRSSSIDDYSETFATETFGGIDLTETECDRIDRILGRSGGAFTIRAPAQPFWSPRLRPSAPYPSTYYG